jgi:hypothetical protein
MPVDHAIHAGGTPGARLQLRSGRLVLYAWLLAAVPIAVLQLAHADLHERFDLPPLVHWLRDTGLAVPAALIAVVVAAAIVARLRGNDAGAVTPVTALAWATIAAILFAVASLPGNQLHGFLFGAEEEEVGLVQDLLDDGIAAFQAALLVIVPLALVAGVPWRVGTPGNHAMTTNRTHGSGALRPRRPTAARSSR